MAKLRNYIKFLFMAVAVLSITACEEDDFDNTDLLCSKIWVDTYDYYDDYYDADVFAIQELTFDYDGYGSNYQYFEYFDRFGTLIKREEENRPFRWKWDNWDETSIYLRYTNGGEDWLDDVQVSEHYLWVLMGDERVRFTDKNIFDYAVSRSTTQKSTRVSKR